MPQTMQARIDRTSFYHYAPITFSSRLAEEIRAWERSAQRRKLTLAIRLNGTSDIAWEEEARGKSLFFRFPAVAFYDYTKRYDRMMAFLRGALPSNYHLTFSRSECNEGECLQVLKRGGGVAVVFRGPELPPSFALAGRRRKAWPVFDGDEDDLRFIEPPHPTGHIIGLRAKGRGRADRSGFVVDPPDTSEEER